jgi:hypothetical protein
MSSDVSGVRAASIIRAMALIALMMEAARTSETSVEIYFTRQYIPEDKSEQRSVIYQWCCIARLSGFLIR